MPRATSMTNRQIASIAVMALCGAALWAIRGQVNDGNTAYATGAALLPDVAVTLILLFTGGDMLLARGEDDVAMARPQALGLGIVAGAMAAYAALLPYLGYLLSSAALLVLLMLLTGGRRPGMAGIITAAAVTSLFLGMKYGFGVNLPAWPAWGG